MEERSMLPTNCEFESEYVSTEIILRIKAVEKTELFMADLKNNTTELMSNILRMSFKHLAKIKATIDDFEIIDLIRYDLESLIIHNFDYCDKNLLDQKFYIYYTSRKGRYHRTVIDVRYNMISQLITVTKTTDFISERTYMNNRNLWCYGPMNAPERVISVL